MSDEYVISFGGREQSVDVFEKLKKSEYLSISKVNFLEFKKNKMKVNSKFNLRIYVHGDDLLIYLYSDFSFFIALC